MIWHSMATAKAEHGSESGPCFNIKTVFPGIGNSCYKDKTVMIPCYLHDGSWILIRWSFHIKTSHWNNSKHPKSHTCGWAMGCLLCLYSDVMMGAMASKMTSLKIVYWTVYSGADQRKHQSSASLAFVREFTGDWWIPRTNGQWRGKCFLLMMSSFVFIKIDSTIKEPHGTLPFLQKYEITDHIDGLMQERRNSIANALQLCLLCTNPLIS